MTMMALQVPKRVPSVKVSGELAALREGSIFCALLRGQLVFFSDPSITSLLVNWESIAGHGTFPGPKKNPGHWKPSPPIGRPPNGTGGNYGGPAILTLEDRQVVEGRRAHQSQQPQSGRAPVRFRVAKIVNNGAIAILVYERGLQRVAKHVLS